MSGLELYAKLRARGDSLPVISITGFDSLEHVTRPKLPAPQVTTGNQSMTRSCWTQSSGSMLKGPIEKKKRTINPAMRFMSI